MRRHDVVGLFHLRRIHTEGMKALYYNTAIRSLSLSLVGLYVPVFVFVRARDIWGGTIQAGFMGLGLYYFIERLTMLVTIIPAGHLVKHKGFVWSVNLSNVIYALCLLFLALAKKKLFWLIFGSAFFSGLMVPFYWLAFHTLFSKGGRLRHTGRDVGVRNIIERLADIAGPAMGGLIIGLWGFDWLFVLALVTLLFSGIPLLLIEKMPDLHHDLSLRIAWQWLKETKHWNEEVAYVGRQLFAMVGGVFYVIFMYLIADSYQKIGILNSISLFVGMVFVYLAGRLHDKSNNPWWFRIASLVMAVIWFLRAFVQTFLGLTISDFSMKALFPFYGVPFDSMTYERAHAKGEHSLTFFATREIIYSLVQIVVLGFVVLVAAFEWRWYAIFGLAAIGSLMTMVMWEGKGK